MPYDWVDPETVVSALGPDGHLVAVYHIYKDDDMQSGQRTFHFTTSIAGTEDDCFDVRELKVLEGEDLLRYGVNEGIGNAIEEALRRAIKSGELVDEDSEVFEEVDDGDEEED